MRRLAGASDSPRSRSVPAVTVGEADGPASVRVTVILPWFTVEVAVLDCDGPADAIMVRDGPADIPGAPDGGHRLQRKMPRTSRSVCITSTIIRMKQ